jgi:hypothetical protein
MTVGASPRFLARMAGFFYLMVIVTGMAGLSAADALIVRGDAAATAANILNSELQYRLSFVSTLVSYAAYVAVTGLLYVLLKPANNALSLVAAFFSLTGCAVAAAASVNALAPLVLLGGSPYLAVFNPEQLQALAMTALRLDGVGANISGVFFGSYCLLLGFLVVESTFLPRLLGPVLAVAGLAWLVRSFTIFLWPALASEFSSTLMNVGGLGEAAFTLWLLVMGVSPAKWHAQARAAEG